MQKYIKLFSRDFCLPSVEIWIRGECTNPKGWTDKKQPFLPYQIVERADDTVHFYYDIQGVEWGCDLLLKLARKDKNFLKKLEKTVLEKISFIKPIYEKGEAITFSKLKRYLKEYEEGFPWFEAMWLFTESGLESKFVELNLKNIRKLRVSTDKMCGGSDTIIRKSLEKLYPKLGPLSSVINIKELLSGKIPGKEVLAERYNGYFFVDNQLFTTLTKSYIEQKFGICFEQNEIKKVRQLSGATAFRGIVRGFVRRVMGHKQIGQVQKGEILVSPMTIPDFLPAMKKAAAIVTDEGGVLCHAAVIAREFEKPCIVGTGIATKRLRDFDIVEVNANEGKVSLICHASIVANKLKKPCIVGTKFATDLFEDGDYIEVDADRGLITLINKKDELSKFKKTIPWNFLFE